MKTTVVKVQIMVQVNDKSSGKALGVISPEDFRTGLEAPRSVSLADVVKAFNATRKNQTAELVVKGAS